MDVVIDVNRISLVHVQGAVAHIPCRPSMNTRRVEGDAKEILIYHDSSLSYDKKNAMSVRNLERELPPSH